MPLNTVLRRGAVFLFHKYDQLDDPNLAGQTKAKFVVVLSTSHQDDPIVYLVTTSETAKRAALPYMFKIEAAEYAFFPVATLLPVGTAGATDIDREKFRALYERGEVDYKGSLSEGHIGQIADAIQACPTVSRRFKQTLAPRRAQVGRSRYKYRYSASPPLMAVVTAND